MSFWNRQCTNKKIYISCIYFSSINFGQDVPPQANPKKMSFRDKFLAFSS